jgi:hypothetical protein
VEGLSLSGSCKTRNVGLVGIVRISGIQVDGMAGLNLCLPWQPEMGEWMKESSIP